MFPILFVIIFNTYFDQLFLLFCSRGVPSAAATLQDWALFSKHVRADKDRSPEQIQEMALSILSSARQAVEVNTTVALEFSGFSLSPTDAKKLLWRVRLSAAIVQEQSGKPSPQEVSAVAEPPPAPWWQARDDAELVNATLTHGVGVDAFIEIGNDSNIPWSFCVKHKEDDEAKASAAVEKSMEDGSKPATLAKLGVSEKQMQERLWAYLACRGRVPPRFGSLEPFPSETADPTAQRWCVNLPPRSDESSSKKTQTKPAAKSAALKVEDGDFEDFQNPPPALPAKKPTKARTKTPNLKAEALQKPQKAPATGKRKDTSRQTTLDAFRESKAAATKPLGCGRPSAREEETRSSIVTDAEADQLRVDNRV